MFRGNDEKSRATSRLPGIALKVLFIEIPN